MATITQHQQPTPERFFNAVNAYEQTEAMKAALELEIFTAIAEGNNTAATIAKHCQAAERGVRTLCDFLTIHGFLTKEGVQYALAPDSAMCHLPLLAFACDVATICHLPPLRDHT